MAWLRTENEDPVNDCDDRSRAAAGDDGFGSAATGGASLGGIAQGMQWIDAFPASLPYEAEAPARTLPICACRVLWPVNEEQPSHAAC